MSNRESIKRVADILRPTVLPVIDAVDSGAIQLDGDVKAAFDKMDRISQVTLVTLASFEAGLIRFENGKLLEVGS